jgi:hypothetical protein
MSHVNAYSGRVDPINCPANTGYKKCPTCGFATIYEGHELAAQDWLTVIELLLKIRRQLKQSPVDKETRLLIQEIDNQLLKV